MCAFSLPRPPHECPPHQRVAARGETRPVPPSLLMRERRGSIFDRFLFWSRSRGVCSVLRIVRPAALTTVMWLVGGAAGAAAQTGARQESPALRSLRQAELSLFGAPSSHVAGQALAQVSLPVALRAAPVPSEPLAETSDPENAAGGDVSLEGLAWLEDLELPDIPVRWDERVVRYIEFFRDDPRGRATMRTWLERVHRYGEMVRGRFREMGMPEDLLYVAMMESGFDPHARSHASAVGMWQFVRRTGEEYGLTVDHWLDERRDPEKSTEAAAKYLQDLHGRLGSWELSLAAYNMGYSALLRAMRKYNSNDYWLLSKLESGLPYETSFYVAKVMACAVIGRNPERFGFSELEQEPPITYDHITVPGGTSVALLARASESSREEVEFLNPQIRRNRLPPTNERYTLRVPAGQAAVFARRWTRLRPDEPAYARHVVRFGETLEHVAAQYGVSERQLVRINDAEDTSDLTAGTTLLVPAVEPKEKPPEDKPVVAVPTLDAPPTGRRRVFYESRYQDEIEDVAKFFRVSVDELRRWNHLDPEASLPSGLFVQVYVPKGVDLRKARVFSLDDVVLLEVASETFFAYHEAQRERVRFAYTVRAGDSLRSLAERFELSVGSLARINRFSLRADLNEGDVIWVYAPREKAPRDAIARADNLVKALGSVPPPPVREAMGNTSSSPVASDEGAAQPDDAGETPDDPTEDGPDTESAATEG